MLPTGKTWPPGSSQSHQIQPLDLIIALAGISRGTFSREETTEETRAVFAVNLDGMLNTVEPAIPLFRQRGRGQIALTSSLAGTRGFPVAPSYCATKAAIRVYGEALRSRLRRENIFVSVINPGFIKSSMTDANPYPMPFLVSVERAATIIKNKLAKGQARICFPRPYCGRGLFAVVVSTFPGRPVYQAEMNCKLIRKLEFHGRKKSRHQPYRWPWFTAPTIMLRFSPSWWKPYFRP